MPDEHDDTKEQTPQKSFYDRIGGAMGVRRLVDRFYDLMDELPEAKALRDLHPASLTESREKLYEFMCGWLGGPPLYVQKRGHPRLRARHLPFVIDDDGVKMWLHCMELAMDELAREHGDTDAVEKLKGGLRPLAAHMKNVE
jgi:hemoglobin